MVGDSLVLAPAGRRCQAWREKKEGFVGGVKCKKNLWEE